MAGLIGTLAIGLALIAWLAAVVLVTLLMAQRCPNCGKRFALRAVDSWPGNACKHCLWRIR